MSERERQRERGEWYKKNLPYLTGNNSSWLRSICCTIFSTITISQTPLVSLVSGWEKKVHFLFPSKYRTQRIISQQIYTFKHVGRHWWESSIILGDNNAGAVNIMKVVPFITRSLFSERIGYQSNDDIASWGTSQCFRSSSAANEYSSAIMDIRAKTPTVLIGPSQSD